MRPLPPLLALTAVGAALVAAPAGAADSVVVGDGADGRRLAVDRGELLKVRVVESPSTGSSWGIAKRPARPVLRYVERTFVPDEAPDGTVGVRGRRTFVWRAAGRGRTSLRLVLRAPGTGRVLERISIVVRVR